MKHGLIVEMGGHAHNEYIEDMSTLDIIVLTVLVLLLFLVGLYLLSRMRRLFVKYIQREIKKELEASGSEELRSTPVKIF